MNGIHFLPIDELEVGGGNAPVVENYLSGSSVLTASRGATRIREWIQPDVPLDALVVNKASRILFVNFHGATNRETTDLPRFERLRTLLEYDVSSMFLTDPGLYLDPKIQLTWYTGWSQVHLPKYMARLIRRVSKEIGVSRIILSGSSGGGFAALQTSRFIPESLCVPFNAQTDITSYRVGESTGVRNLYFKTVWPELWQAFEQTDKPDDWDWVRLIGDRISNIVAYSKPVENRVHIVQNEQEPHYKEHFLPFVAAAQEAGNSITFETNLEGPIHNPPRTPTFARVFESVVEQELANIARE